MLALYLVVYPLAARRKVETSGGFAGLPNSPYLNPSSRISPLQHKDHPFARLLSSITDYLHLTRGFLSIREPHRIGNVEGGGFPDLTLGPVAEPSLLHFPSNTFHPNRAVTILKGRGYS